MITTIIMALLATTSPKCESLGDGHYPDTEQRAGHPGQCGVVEIGAGCYNMITIWGTIRCVCNWDLTTDLAGKPI